MTDYGVLWSENARQGIREEADYIRNHTARSPRAWIVRILERVNQLRELPRIGPPWPTGNHLGIRQLTAEDYVLLYMVDDDEKVVHILSVRHGRRAAPDPGDLVS